MSFPTIKLDAPTLDFVTIANLLTMSVAMYLIWTLNKRERGILHCAMGGLVLCVGFAAVPLRSLIPGKLTILLPNLLIFAGAMFVLDGVRSFRRFHRETGIYVLISVSFTSSLCYWLFIDDNIGLRIVVVSLFWGGGTLWCAYSMAVGVAPRDRSVYWTTAAVFGIDGAALLLRAASAFSGHVDSNGFNQGLVGLLNFVTLNLGITGCAFGLSMATNLKLRRESETLAFEDSLTGLPNRRFFEDRLEQAERRAFETGHHIALIYCDLDDFKGINDTLGHEGGDKALRMVSQRLRRAISDDICLARVGGDEFVLLVEDMRSRDDINALIERLRRTVEGGIEFHGHSAELKISCGLAVYPDDVGSVSDLMRLADAGMYMMKQHGRFSPAERAGQV